MREMVKMVVVLLILSTVSGGLLAAVKNGTQERIENQQLQFVKGPAISSIMEGAANNPIADRFKMSVGDTEKSFFIGVFNGKPTGVAFETFGKGYGGEVGLMVGIDMENDKLLGVGVTTHQETPGMGAKAKTDPTFAAQFRGMPLRDTYQVTTDGGQVNAISGATLSSRAVCQATTKAAKLYREHKEKITDQMKAFAK